MGIIVVIIIVAVVGYLLLKPRAISKANSIVKLQEFIDKCQPYIAQEREDDIKKLEKDKREKQKNNDWEEWDEDDLVRNKQYRDEYLSLIRINSRLTEKYRGNQDALYEQLLDWGMFLEMQRDMYLDRSTNRSMIEQGYDAGILADLDNTPEKEVQRVDTAAKITAILDRIRQRAVEANIPHKALDDILKRSDQDK